VVAGQGFLRMTEHTLVDPEVLGAILGLVWPGLISIHVYKLLIPSQRIDWGQAVLQGFFFTVINYLLLFPLVVFVLRPTNLEQRQVLYWLALAVMWLLGPIALPVIWKWLLGTRLLGRYLQQPYPTPWDYYFDYFDRREPSFMIIHLKNGRLLGGHWGPRSYASAYPDQGDLYLSAVHRVDPKGRLGQPVPSTKGLLIRRDEYTYIELFEVPVAEVRDA
jgi:hypothetical protein